MNQNPYDHTSQFVSERGRQICYLPPAKFDSSKPNILLLHGNPASMDDWSEMLGPMRFLGNVAALDFPGFGRSPLPGTITSDFSLDAFAGDVIDLADHLGWKEPFCLIGHSHGGGVAQTVAVRHPNRMKAIVLIGTLGYPKHDSYKLLSTPGVLAILKMVSPMFGIERLKGFWRLILKSSMKSIYSPDRPPRDKIDAQLQMFIDCPPILVSMSRVTLGQPNKQLFDLVDQIKCPVLFLHGDKDYLVPSSFARNIHDRIIESGGDSKFIVIENAGHMTFQFQVEELVEAIREFL